MHKRYFGLYFIVFTIPVFMGITAWQSVRYTDLEKETRVLETAQEKLVDENKKIIADIAMMTSSEKVESIAAHDLNLIKIQPENVLQIWIERR